MDRSELEYDWVEIAFNFSNLLGLNIYITCHIGIVWQQAVTKLKGTVQRKLRWVKSSTNR
jgi:hypothetical protein